MAMSSPVPATLRRLVMERAHGVCEYCLIREDDCDFDFQIEHIISEKHGGQTVSENLAAACVLCNRFKGSDVASISPTTGNVVRLYHPRRDRWSSHFGIQGPLIVPITEVGEATIRLLKLNDDARVLERQVLQAVHRYPRMGPK